MPEVSDQVRSYLARKAANLEEMADHHAAIGEPDKARELYTQALALYSRQGDDKGTKRVKEKLETLKE